MIAIKLYFAFQAVHLVCCIVDEFRPKWPDPSPSLRNRNAEADALAAWTKLVRA